MISFLAALRARNAELEEAFDSTNRLCLNAIKRVAGLTAQLDEAHKREVALRGALVRLRDCDWVITLPDRMDAVRQIAREALDQTAESATAWLKAHDREVLDRFIESLAVELPRVTYRSSKGYDRTGAFKDYHIKAIQDHLRAAILGEEEP